MKGGEGGGRERIQNSYFYHGGRDEDRKGERVCTQDSRRILKFKFLLSLFGLKRSWPTLLLDVHIVETIAYRICVQNCLGIMGGRKKRKIFCISSRHKGEAWCLLR